MHTVSVIMPIYNVERFVADAIDSVLAQTYPHFELIIVNDCSPDNSVAICQAYTDERIRIVNHHENRGLAGARNTGVRHACSEYVAFLDSDDTWHPDKLKEHVAHLEQHSDVGLSFSRSAFIDEDGQATKCYQMPKLTHIDAAEMFSRNPIGNGSAPVLRHKVLKDIEYHASHNGKSEARYFDSELRRSEDIECWLRIALTTEWKIEGIPKALTNYRLNNGGLSAQLDQQLASWEQVAEKTRRYAPEFVAEQIDTARAFQLRYLCRQAIRLRSGQHALNMLKRAIKSDWRIFVKEPSRSISTAGAAFLLRVLPVIYPKIENFAAKVIGSLQQARIQSDLNLKARS